RPAGQRAYDGAERVHDDDAGLEALDLRADPSLHGVEVALQCLRTEVQVVNGSADEPVVEELELLLVAQHLDGWLAQDREMQRRPLDRRVREHDLRAQRGLAGARIARDQVERVDRHTTAQDLVQPRNTGSDPLDRYIAPTHRGAAPCGPAMVVRCRP